MIVRKNENYGVSGSLGEQDYDRVIYGGYDGTYIKTSDYENDKKFQRRQIKSLEFRNKILCFWQKTLEFRKFPDISKKW